MARCCVLSICTRASAVLAALCLIWAGIAQAHFQLNVSLRMIHIEPTVEGIRVFMRLPMPLLVADKMGPERADGSREPAPYTHDATENGQLMHYLDVEALQHDPVGLGRIAADGHQFVVNGKPLTARVEALRAHPLNRQPLFANLEQARKAMAGSPFDEGAATPYAGDTAVDVALFYPFTGAIQELSIASSLKPGVRGENELANLVLYYAGGKTYAFRARGLMQTPLAIASSPLAAAKTFIFNEGIPHILFGLDHVLFVLCLIVGARRLGSLLWRITGFTLGHTVTLVVGFLGYAPTGAWFIPAVDVLIAVSIIYAGVVALVQVSDKTTFVVTAMLGLLHGFGFSQYLREILKVDAPNAWVSLVSFNVGVEIGQIAIVLAVWPLLYVLNRELPKAARLARFAIVLPCIAVAAWLTVQRLGVLLG